jgi:predicted transposase/invertase (TIGR01784 family)
MPDITNPHDKFFKEALTQPGAALAFLRDYLPPDVAAHLDLTHLQLVKDSFVDEALQEHFSDLVYEVALRNAGRAYICVLFEHKSYVDSLSALQVLRYMVHGWEYSLRQQARLWPVIPVVVYHGAAPWTVATNFQALFDLPDALGVYVPEFEYLLTDLSTYSDEEIKRTAELGVGLLVLKHIFRPDLHTRLPEVLSLWYTMRQQEHALRYLEAIIRYVTAAGQHVKAEDVRAALAAVTPEGDAMIGTIAQEWIQQGEQRGEQRGLRRGLLDGIELALELRFGLDGLRLLPEITQIEDVGVLKAVHEAIRSVTRPEELRQFYLGDE